MSKTIQMCFLIVGLIAVQALADDLPYCNGDIQDDTSYKYCTGKVECSDKTVKDGCSTQQVTPSPSSFYYKCKGGTLPSDDCVIDDTERQCAAVYKCKDPGIFPPPQGAACLQGGQALNDQGQPRYVYTINTAQSRDCVVKGG